MKTRLLGRTDIAVSEVGLGCWQLGGTDWGALSEQEALAILGAAAEEGVTFFDTADVYGDGRAEEVLGKFLKTRTGCFVATKLGRTDALYPDKYSEATLRAATEASLRRLGVEALDLTQLHCIPTEELRKGEVFGWMQKLKDEGKIRHFGASVESMEEALLCLGQPGIVSLQIIFNIFRQRPIAELFPTAQERGVALIARLPLASGLLSGKFTRDTTFPANDHRTYNCDGQVFNVGETFAGIPFDKGVELAGEMNAFVPDGLSLAQMAQRWILDYDEVSVVIPGASTVAQARENSSVTALPELTPQTHARLEKYYTTQVAPFIRGAY